MKKFGNVLWGIVLIVIGLIIGLFIIAMVIPMFDAINSIQ